MNVSFYKRQIDAKQCCLSEEMIAKIENFMVAMLNDLLIFKPKGDSCNNV